MIWLAHAGAQAASKFELGRCQATDVNYFFTRTSFRAASVCKGKRKAGEAASASLGTSSLHFSSFEPLLEVKCGRNVLAENFS